MSLQQSLTEYVKACCTGLWIESHEHLDALSELSSLCTSEGWSLGIWDCENGLQRAGAAKSTPPMTDPLEAIRSFTMLDGAATTILVLVNFHKYLQSPEILQALAERIQSGKQDRAFVVILSPVVTIPPELEKMFLVVEHELPTRAQIEQIARSIANQEGELPSGADLSTVLDAASGLTRLECENAFSLSLVRHEQIVAETIWEMKAQTLRKSNLLTLHRGKGSFTSIGGLASLKAFCKRAIQRSNLSSVRPRGVMLLSPPGCGKSQFCKLLGNETGRPVLVLDVGSLMGSLVGQTEERTRQALRIVDAMAPCVLMIDEIEKAFAGLGSNGDSGVASRMFGAFLTWLNDHQSDVFVVCTSNDISKLPPEFGRSERFDGLFFLDLPNEDEKTAIWELYKTLYAIDPDGKLPDDSLWTGAEIKSCCRLSKLLDIPLVQAAQNVVPVALTASESIERLRNWANGRCLSASNPGIYSSQNNVPSKRRKLIRPSTAI
jgi:ATP-dependent 26S proteasome regulatory subunit